MNTEDAPQPVSGTSSPARIDATITSQGRKYAWVAEQAGMSESTFRRKMKGHVDFTVREVALIARALIVHPSTLLPPEFDEAVEPRTLAAVA